MIPQLKRAEHRSAQQQHPQRYAPLKEQRAEDYAPLPSVDKLAGQEARLIIRALKLEDTTAQWKALKEAYLKGFEEARR